MGRRATRRVLGQPATLPRPRRAVRAPGDPCVERPAGRPWTAGPMARPGGRGAASGRRSRRPAASAARLSGAPSCAARALPRCDGRAVDLGPLERRRAGPARPLGRRPCRSISRCGLTTGRPPDAPSGRRRSLGALATRARGAWRWRTATCRCRSHCAATAGRSSPGAGRGVAADQRLVGGQERRGRPVEVEPVDRHGSAGRAHRGGTRRVVEDRRDRGDEPRLVADWDRQRAARRGPGGRRPASRRPAAPTPPPRPRPSTGPRGAT